MYEEVLKEYGLKEVKAEPFGSGLINNTWKITGGDKTYILQKINETVFSKPADIAHNIRVIAEYLQKHHPGYLFIAPLTFPGGEQMIYKEGAGFFRLFSFVSGSHSKNSVETTGQAFEAAVQFGRFTRLLSGIDVNQLRITISSFHDLALRYRQFQSASHNGDRQRTRIAGPLIKLAEKHAGVAGEYEKIRSNPGLRLRVTHHDTKISNVLFDKNDKALCVIDLDTVMPGYFISDMGDMMRTYLSAVSEEEKDVNTIEVRDDMYKAIVEGYYSEMKDELTDAEKKLFFYAGKYMIYMQALRFLTDYLTGDTYYKALYPEHNLTRAQNQLVLLERLIEKESLLIRVL